MRVFSLVIAFLVAFSCFCIPVSAATVRLSFDEWLEFYNLPDSPDNLGLYQALSNGIIVETNAPLDISEDIYDEFKNSGSTAPNSDDNDLSVDSGLPVSDLADLSSVSVPDLSAQSESSDSSIALMSLQPVPTSGQSYVLPELVETEYAPDAESGTLTAAIYSLIGKPVRSYTYKVRTSTSSSGYDGYVMEVLDFDLGWCGSFLMLLLVVYCIFKVGGGLLCKK